MLPVALYQMIQCFPCTGCAGRLRLQLLNGAHQLCTGLPDFLQLVSTLLRILPHEGKPDAKQQHINNKGNRQHPQPALATTPEQLLPPGQQIDGNHRGFHGSSCDANAQASTNSDGQIPTGALNPSAANGSRVSGSTPQKLSSVQRISGSAARLPYNSTCSPAAGISVMR